VLLVSLAVFSVRGTREGLIRGFSKSTGNSEEAGKTFFNNKREKKIKKIVIVHVQKVVIVLIVIVIVIIIFVIVVFFGSLFRGQPFDVNKLKQNGNFMKVYRLHKSNRLMSLEVSMLTVVGKASESTVAVWDLSLVSP